MKFFVSYSRSVRPDILRMVELLRAKGHQVWWDADIPPMAPWWGTIVDKIGWCEVFVFVISEKSLQSPYCMAELRYATDRNRPIFPFIIDDTKRDTIPPQVTPKLNQWLEYKGDIDETTGEIILASARLDRRLYIDNPSVQRPSKPGKDGSSSLTKQFRQAIILAEDGHFEEAAREFREIEAIDPEKWGDDCRHWITKLGFYSEIAELAEDHRILKRARKQWTDFLTQYKEDDWFDPLDVEAKVSKQDESKKRSDTSSTIPVQLAAPAHSAEEVMANMYFVRAYHRPSNDYDLQIADYSEAIRYNPQLASAYYNRGNIYRAIGQDEQAIADYTEVVRLDPDHKEAYNNRGLRYYDKKEYDRAIADYTKYLSINLFEG